MELKEGMYIRTQVGFIEKIKTIEPYNWQECINGHTYSVNVLKASYDIIDLIEVGDIISFKHYIDNYKYTYAVRIISLIYLDEIKDMIKTGEYRLFSILTQEQFENYEYKVGDK